ncbi:MAG: radical SAM protein [Candidatus Micrarchaeota archaeon]
MPLAEFTEIYNYLLKFTSPPSSTVESAHRGLDSISSIQNSTDALKETPFSETLRLARITLGRFEEAGITYEQTVNQARNLAEKLVSALHSVRNLPWKGWSLSNDQIDFLFDVVMPAQKAERELRNMLSGKRLVHPDIMENKDTISILEIHVTERCMVGCPFCGNASKPNNPVMDIQMVHDLLQSPQVSFDGSKTVYIGSAEVLAYPYPRELAECAISMVKDYGIFLGFNISGLLPPNRHFGKTFLEGLAEFGPYAQDVVVFLSINPMNPYAVKDSSAYIDSLADTIGLLKAANVRHYLNARYREESEQDAVFQLIKRLESRCGHSLGKEIRPINAIGDGVNVIGNVYTGRCDIWFKTDPQFGIRHNGEAVVGCCGLGARGSSCGNVYEHDATQLRQNLSVMLRKLRGAYENERIKTSCEFHRTCGINITSPRSSRPILQRR